MTAAHSPHTPSNKQTGALHRLHIGWPFGDGAWGDFDGGWCLVVGVLAEQLHADGAAPSGQKMRRLAARQRQGSGLWPLGPTPIPQERPPVRPPGFAEWASWGGSSGSSGRASWPLKVAVWPILGGSQVSQQLDSWSLVEAAACACVPRRICRSMHVFDPQVDKTGSHAEDFPCRSSGVPELGPGRAGARASRRELAALPRF